MVGLTVQFADRREQPRINASVLAGYSSDQTCSCHADPEPLAGEVQGPFVSPCLDRRHTRVDLTKGLWTIGEGWISQSLHTDSINYVVPIITP
jgi:hypothetical protein